MLTDLRKACCYVEKRGLTYRQNSSLFDKAASSLKKLSAPRQSSSLFDHIVRFSQKPSAYQQSSTCLNRDNCFSTNSRLTKLFAFLENVVLKRTTRPSSQDLHIAAAPAFLLSLNERTNPNAGHYAVHCPIAPTERIKQRLFDGIPFCLDSVHLTKKTLQILVIKSLVNYLYTVLTRVKVHLEYKPQWRILLNTAAVRRYIKPHQKGPDLLYKSGLIFEIIRQFSFQVNISLLTSKSGRTLTEIIYWQHYKYCFMENNFTGIEKL